MKYKYLVTFVAENCTGHTEIITSYRVNENMDNVQEVIEYIKNKNDIPSIVIVNIIPLKKWWEFWK